MQNLHARVFKQLYLNAKFICSILTELRIFFNVIYKNNMRLFFFNNM